MTTTLRISYSSISSCLHAPMQESVLQKEWAGLSIDVDLEECSRGMRRKSKRSSLNELDRLEIPAAEYIRMSTEHQRYSIENQRLAITAYAISNRFRIVRSYIDPGKSG